MLASADDISFDEDGSGSTSLFGSDVDGDDLSYSIAGGSDITATLDGSDISFTPPADYNGSETFTVSVSDGELTDSQSITVTVNAVNDAPVLSSIGDRETSEDEPLNILLSAFDIEGDPLSFSVSGGDEITTTLNGCLLYTSPSPRDISGSRMPSSA